MSNVRWRDRLIRNWALERRQRADERMDDRALDASSHIQALRGLARLNRLSRTADGLWAALAGMEVRHNGGGGPVRVLDLACGSGDITRRLAALAARDGMPFEFDGCDRSGHAVEFADRQSRAGSTPTCRFFARDVLEGPLPDGYGYFVSSLFLHHLADGQAVRLFREMARAARRGFVVHDLERSTRGFLLAGVASRAFTRSPIVHADAVLSVRAAFSLEETIAMSILADLPGVRCTRRWPCRLLLSWAPQSTHGN